MRVTPSLSALLLGLLVTTPLFAETRLEIDHSSALLDGWIGTSLSDGRCLPIDVETGGSLRVGNLETGGCGSFRSFISFDLSSLEGRQVVSADLFLYQTGLQDTLPETAPGIVLDLLDYGNSLEADDWDRAPDAGNAATLSIVQDQAQHRQDVTQLLHFQLDRGKSRLQFRLTPEEAIPGEILFESGDTSTALAPRLEITLADPVVVPVQVRPPDPRFGAPAPAPGTYVGMALANPGPVPNRVTKTQRTADGEIADSAETLLSRRGQEATIVAPAQSAMALSARGNAGAIQGFFMMGNYDLRRLDGIGAELAPSRRLFFPFNRSEATHRLFFFDTMPGSERTLDLRLHSPTGELVEERSLTLSGEGSLAANLEEIFQNDPLLEQGYVEAGSNRSFRAFQLLQSADSFATLAGLSPSAATRLVAPHFFVARTGGSVLTVLNSEAEAVDLRIQALDDQSQLMAEQTIRLAAGHLSRINLAELLETNGGEFSDASPLTGFLIVDTASDREHHLTGFIDFFGAGGAYRSILPLLSEGTRHTRLLHYAQKPVSRIFTGLALLNLGEEPAAAKVRLFERAGGERGMRELAVAADARIVSILDESFFTGSTALDLERGAHVEIESSEPLFVFAIFGDLDLRYLAAIESQRPLSSFSDLERETSCDDASPAIVQMEPDPRISSPRFSPGSQARLEITLWDNSQVSTPLGGFQQGISNVEWDTSQLEALGINPGTTFRGADSPFSALTTLTFAVPESVNQEAEVTLTVTDVEQCTTLLRFRLQLGSE